MRCRIQQPNQKHISTNLMSTKTLLQKQLKKELNKTGNLESIFSQMQAEWTQNPTTRRKPKHHHRERRTRKKKRRHYSSDSSSSEKSNANSSSSSSD